MKRFTARIVGHPWFDYAALLAAIVLLVAIFGSASRYFFTWQTAVAVANRLPDLLVVTVGMTLVLLVGGIDLSVGSVAALSGAVLGTLLVDFELPVAVAVGGALAAAAVCGLFNGAVTVRWNVPSFIVTLGMFEIARGTAYLVTHSQTRFLGSRLDQLAATIPPLHLSAMFMLAVVLVVLGELVLRGTVFGRHLFAVGANEAAARLSGISPRHVRLIVFTVSGILAGLGGVFQAARFSTADPNAGTGMELAAIAAVVIGGTSLSGGRGSILGSFLGVVIVAVLQTGLAQIGASEPSKRVITGMVIVAAVVGDVGRRHLSERSADQ